SAYAIDAPTNETTAPLSPLVFASPHSGRIYPKALLDACDAPLLALRRIEDAFVDQLFAGVVDAGAPLLRALMGRAYVDLNRSEGELDPEMFADSPPLWTGPRSPRVEAGLGCLPRIAHGGLKIYRRKLKRVEAEARIRDVYRPYHKALQSLLHAAEQHFGGAVLIDCHSMPSDVTAGGNEAEIVLGDRFGAACAPALTAFLEREFADRGYRVRRNAPYAGGFVTLTYGRPTQRWHAVQIEIRRDLYMDEARVEPNDGFEALQKDLTGVARALAEWTRAFADNAYKKAS
ncbi:MAG: N-formylglutamate amidohydrolase, partial [Pseudomonadota bacterium]